MKASVTTASYLWAGVFTLVFLLSQDFWFSWDQPPLLGPWNIPLRIYYFVFLQFLLAVVLGVFFAHWPDRKPNDSDQGH